jgi:hypothetical protein
MGDAIAIEAGSGSPSAAFAIDSTSADEFQIANSPRIPGFTRRKRRHHRRSAVPKLEEKNDAATKATKAAIAYDIPQSMTLDAENFVRLSASISSAPKTLEQALQHKPAGRHDDFGSQSVIYAPTLTATLDGDKGKDEIALIDNIPTKFLTDSDAFWEWRVRPLALGNHVLTLTVTSPAVQNGARVFQKVVSIKVGVGETIAAAESGFYSSIVAYITLGGLLSGLFWFRKPLFAYVRNRRKRKQPTSFV